MKAEFCQPSYGKNLANGASLRTIAVFLKPWQPLCQAYRRSRQRTVAFDRKRANLSTLLYGKFQMNGTLCTVNIFSWKAAYDFIWMNGRKIFIFNSYFLYTSKHILWYNININRGDNVDKTKGCEYYHCKVLYKTYKHYISLVRRLSGPQQRVFFIQKKIKKCRILQIFSMHTIVLCSII